MRTKTKMKYDPMPVRQKISLGDDMEKSENKDQYGYYRKIPKCLN